MNSWCEDCDEGRIWNNADPTSGQWVECERCGSDQTRTPMPNRPDDLVVSVEPRNDGGASAKQGETDPCVNCGKPTPTEEWVVHQASCRDCFYDQMEEAK